MMGITTAFLSTAALAQDMDLKIPLPPLPPLPKFLVPKPPVPKLKIATPPAPTGGGQMSHREPHRYQYYPDNQIYFDPARQLYFFLEANRWIARNMLPPQVNIRVGAPPVAVDLYAENPYEYHEEVRRVYPGHSDDRARHSYRAGFDDGYEEGYGDGYNKGYKSMYEKAYQDGYRSGYQDRGRQERQEDRRDDRDDRGRHRGWDKRD